MPETVSAVELAYGKTLATPSPLMVVVEVPPTYRVPKTEARVEEELAKLWSAVQELALPKLRLAVTAAVSEPELATVMEPEEERVAT